MDLDRLPDHAVDGDLELRRWAVTDAPALHEVVTRNLEHLRPWMPWIAHEPQTVEERAALIASWGEDWERGGDVVVGIFLGGRAVGGSGLHRRIGPGGLEVGYWVDAAHTGRGLATRATRALTTLAFSVPGIDRVEIACDQANGASAAVAERLGYHLVATIPRPIAAPAETGMHRIYRMGRDEWDGGPQP